MEFIELGNFAVGSLLGLVLGAFLGHALAIRRSKKQTKHVAAIEFKKVIFPALDKLEQNESQFKVIQDSFEKHYEAALSFSSYLSGEELNTFKKSLSNYKKWQNTMYGRSTAEVMYDTNDPEYLAAQKISPISLIKEMLKYANT